MAIHEDAVARVANGYSPVVAIHLWASGVGDGVVPRGTTGLTEVYPNPFNPRTTITFEVGEPQVIDLSIYDLAGRLVRVIESGAKVDGRFEATWDGLDQRGMAVASGVYFCRLKSAAGTSTRKLLLDR